MTDLKYSVDFVLKVWIMKAHF